MSATLLSPSTFVWHDAPLSDVRAPLTGAVVYVLIVLTLNWYMKTVRNGKGVETTNIQAVHNLVLSLGSLVMFLGALRELLRRGATESQDGAYGRATFFFCEPRGTLPNGPLYYWSYIYYLSKYYELLDTVLQLLKGRPPPHFFLHVYHHAVVLQMCWLWLEYSQSLQWGGLLFNTAVHVVMYYCTRAPAVPCACTHACARKHTHTHARLCTPRSRRGHIVHSLSRSHRAQQTTFVAS